MLRLNSAAQKGISNKNVIVLTDVASCIMEKYDGTLIAKGETRLSKLRGVAVFVIYDTTEIEMTLALGWRFWGGKWW